jgi:hypothetical protein
LAHLKERKARAAYSKGAALSMRKGKKLSLTLQVSYEDREEKRREEANERRDD